MQASKCAPGSRSRGAWRVGVAALAWVTLASWAWPGPIFPWKGAPAPRLNVVLEHPALLPTAKVKRVAIGQITGECGIELGTRITTALVSSKRFEVLDRQNFDRIVKEHNFNWSGKVDTRTAAKLGQALGADILVFGDVSRCTLEQGFVERAPSGAYLGGPTPNLVKVNVARASLTTSLQLVDLATARILTAVVYEGRSEKDFERTLPDKNSVLTGAYTQVVERFTRLLVPWTHTVDVALYEDGDDRWGLKAAAFKIRTGQYAEAAALLRNTLRANQALNDAKMLSRVQHNLGLALLFAENESEAVDALKKAQALRATPESAEALERAQELVAIKAEAPVQPAPVEAPAAVATTGALPVASVISLAGAAGGPPAAGPATARCPHCKGSVTPGASFCPFCGKSLKGPANCSRCGRALPAGAKFCPNDGTPSGSQ